MYILTQSGNDRYLYPLREQQGMTLNGGILSFNGGAFCRIINGTVTAEEAAARFDDIVRALKSKKVEVYDVSKPIGTQPKAPQKAAPAPEPAPKESAK